MSTKLSTLGDILQSMPSGTESPIALTIRDEQRSYSEFRRRAEQAGERIATDVTRGARIGLLSTDRFESFELLFAAAYAAAVMTPLNLKLAAAELEYIVNDAEVQILFVEKQFYPLVEAFEARLQRRPTIIALDGEHARWPAYRAWRESAPTPLGVRPATRDDVVAQLYTSGTTGRPKGVQLPHRSFFAVHDAMRDAGETWFLWQPGDIGLLNLPFFHVGSAWWVTSCFAAGCELVVIPAFNPTEVLQAIGKHRVTRLGFVPAMLQMVLADPLAKQTDFSSVRQCFYGGSPIASTLLYRAQRRMGCDFGQFYGMTETGNAVLLLRPEDHRSTDQGLLRAAGKPFAGVEVKCVDREGRAVPPGTVGEICIKSESNMVGYWRLPRETAETLREGWIHSGDGGYIDENGYVFITDRIKDMVICAGENIYPAEVEEALLKHPAVAEAAVIGVPHEHWGEVVKAFVVVQPGTSPRAAELIDHARRDIAEYKLPRSIDFVSTLPRNSMGKVRRAELRAPYWQARERQVN